MCSPSAPPPPDYQAQAQAQGQANIDAARSTSKLNNPNVVSPLGTQSVTYGGGAPSFDQRRYDQAMREWEQTPTTYTDSFDRSQANDRYPNGTPVRTPNPRGPAPSRDNYWNPNGDQDVPTITQQFSPEQQGLYDKSVQTKGLLGDLGIQGAQSLKGLIGTPLDYSGAPAAPGNAQATRDSVIQAMMSRVNEDTTNRRDQTNSDLIARGITPGTKAYNDAMFAIDRGHNDARQSAIVAGGQEAQRDFGMDSEARRSYIAELLSKRQMPLNEISALMSGSQVSNPFQVPGYGSAGQVAPAPVFGAGQAASNYQTDLYNSEVGRSNALQSGLFALGSAALISDRRLKSNIKRIGDHPLGIGVYEYDIFGKRDIGVMAQEVLAVKPEAVISHPDGYLMVDYGRL